MTEEKKHSNKGLQSKKDVQSKEEKQMKELQQKYMELQMMEQQMKMLQQQLQKFEQQIQEIRNVEEALDNIKKAEPGSEMFVPMTGGIFVKAKLEDTKHLLVNVGSNVTVEKTVDETKELLKAQLVEIVKYRDELTTQFHQMGARSQLLQKELESMVG